MTRVSWVNGTSTNCLPTSARTCQPLPGPPYESRSEMADECYVATFTKHPVTYAVSARLANAHWGSASAVADLGSVQIAFLGVFARWGPWLISNDARSVGGRGRPKQVRLLRLVKSYSLALNGKNISRKMSLFCVCSGEVGGKENSTGFCLLPLASQLKHSHFFWFKVMVRCQ